MPIANVVAPPVRETSVSSPTSWAAASSASAPVYTVPSDCHSTRMRWPSMFCTSIRLTAAAAFCSGLAEAE